MSIKICFCYYSRVLNTPDYIESCLTHLWSNQLRLIPGVNRPFVFTLHVLMCFLTVMETLLDHSGLPLIINAVRSRCQRVYCSGVLRCITCIMAAYGVVQARAGYLWGSVCKKPWQHTMEMVSWLLSQTLRIKFSGRTGLLLTFDILQLTNAGIKPPWTVQKCLNCV